MRGIQLVFLAGVETQGKVLFYNTLPCVSTSALIAYALPCVSNSSPYLVSRTPALTLCLELQLLLQNSGGGELDEPIRRKVRHIRSGGKVLFNLEGVGSNVIHAVVNIRIWFIPRMSGL